jgi:excisionase family DNA binding protein
MAQNYYSVEKAAQVLGVSADEIRAMLDRRELYGYRDGSSWKFKAEEIDRRAAERNQGPIGDDDIMLDEALLSGSSDKLKAGSGKGKDDFDLAMDDDLTLDQAPAAKKGKGKDGGKSDILSDDDMVLGGSGTGSDITLGGNSGINLVAPSDSGLSLESTGAGDDSLELGEDDMVSLGDDSADAPTTVRADEEFLLTAAEDTGDEDDESGSQVIALDSEPAADQAATLIGTPSTAQMVAMLEEDASAAPMAAGAAVGLAAVGMGTMSQPGGIAAAEPMLVETDLPETPFSGLQIFGLATCTVLLTLCGMMAFDLVRNMWSWNGTYPVNSAIMDRLVSLIGG